MAHKATPKHTARLIAVLLSGRNERTARAYRSDLDDFRLFVGAGTIQQAAQTLLQQTHSGCNGLVLEYRASLVERGLSPSTVNRRLSALRSMVRHARVLGLVPWTVEVSNVRSEPYRDTRGPGREGVQRMLRALERRKPSAKVKRDRAAVRLMFDLALRREEVVSLDLADLDIAQGTLKVLGKGRTQRTTLTMPEPTRRALCAWVAERGDEPGPLFGNFDRAGKGHRLTGRSLHRIVRELAGQAGLPRVSPHGLRHAAITEALDLTDGDVRAVQRFSRHRDLRVLNIYDDCREDLAGQVARLVAAGRQVGRARWRRRGNGAAAEHEARVEARPKQ